jgi:hypothetical protein
MEIKDHDVLNFILKKFTIELYIRNLYNFLILIDI